MKPEDLKDSRPSLLCYMRNSLRSPAVVSSFSYRKINKSLSDYKHKEVSRSLYRQSLEARKAYHYKFLFCSIIARTFF